MMLYQKDGSCYYDDKDGESLALKNAVLVIEDSPAITILLKNYLENMGYSDVYVCDSGSSAIYTFKELIESGKNPIVLLDFVLPDMDARSILTQILEIQPNARVILETATEKDDSGVKELIRLGVYQYIEKPIRLEKLKDIFETIEKESSFFNREVDDTKKAEMEASLKLTDQINFLFKSYKQLSIIMIEDILGFFNDHVESYLKELEKKGNIVSIGEKREIACNQCGSVKKTQVFFCPSCKSSNFKIAKLIEHYTCGNVSEESKYVDDVCPGCQKEIKALGVDYKVMHNQYICNNCKDVFPELATFYMCLKCENKYSLDEAGWKNSPYYKLVNIL